MQNKTCMGCSRKVEKNEIFFSPYLTEEYPIWWHEAAWVVNRFVKDNDFTGKTVIPFCTSSSSELGESGTHLAEMAGTGEWQEGRRFSSSASENEVTGWLAGLGF